MLGLAKLDPGQGSFPCFEDPYETSAMAHHPTGRVPAANTGNKK
jgi:hypothetical protein